MRIVYMGTPDFAVQPLESLIKCEKHEVLLVVTQPDKPKGRSGKLQMPPVKETALQYDIPVVQPERVRNNQEFYERLTALAPDLIVVAAFGQLLPENVLNCPKYGCINIHASLLPKYRGAAPIQWAVLNGDEKTGITIMQMAKGMDTGDIIAKKELRLSEDETGGSLFEKLAVLSRQFLLDTIDTIEKGTAKAVPQREEEATYAPMLSKETGRIDWKDSAVKIERYVRGCNPWPCAYTTLDGKTVKLWKSRMMPRDGWPGEYQALPIGSIFVTNHKTLGVITGEGILELLELQLEGKKRMETSAFIAGYRFGENPAFDVSE